MSERSTGRTSRRVERFHDPTAKTEALRAAVEEATGPGIVYVATRAHAEEIADLLSEGRLRVAAYHAGLPAKRRRETQAAFKAGELDVIVATTAFGMGVDKPDVRFVFHYDVSDSLDSYYQEIGRAGRDGQPALAVMFYRPEDLGIRRYFAGASGFDEDELDAILERVPAREEVELAAVAHDIEISMPRLLRALAVLESVGAVSLIDSRTVRRSRKFSAAATGRAEEELEQHDQFQRTRVEMMQRYAELTSCRRTMLLAYFGDAYEPPCNACDNCLSSAPPAVDAASQAADAPPWAIPGASVVHDKFGPGQVIQVEPGRLVVLFEDVGYRVLDIEAARDVLWAG